LVTISAEMSSDSPSYGKNVPMGGITSRRITSRSVKWTEYDGETEWEAGEVWVSPNLKSILEEIVGQPEWKVGNAITFFIQGMGAVRNVYTRDSGDCLAPTLSIQLDVQC